MNTRFLAQRLIRPAVISRSIVSGPPRVKITFAEKVVHAIVYSLGVTAIPMWVLLNIKHYRS